MNEFDINVITTLEEKLSRTKDPIQSMLMSKIIRAKSVIQDKRVQYCLLCFDNKCPGYTISICNFPGIA